MARFVASILSAGLAIVPMISVVHPVMVLGSLAIIVITTTTAEAVTAAALQMRKAMVFAATGSVSDQPKPHGLTVSVRGSSVVND